MRVLGIIAEYNPFHNGHLYHLNQSVKMISPDYTVCVMSGNFTQRGEPALTDKWTRAEIAVKNGVDLVIELPFVFACNNAEHFSYGAIEILNGLGCISHLSFGSESGEIDLIQETANYLAYEDETLQSGIKEFSELGYSFPRARYEAVKKYGKAGCADILKTPNNILAVEYIKQIILSKSKMQPITLRRFGVGYHDTESFKDIASATMIRETLLEKQSLSSVESYLPKVTRKVLMDSKAPYFTSTEHFYMMVMHKILTSNPESLKAILSATEGLEHRVIKAAIRSRDLNSLIGEIISKRYTATRIQRLLVHVLIGLDKKRFTEIVENRLLYARVLGFNKKGAALLKQIKKEKMNNIPIITNINRETTLDWNGQKTLKFDILSSDIYNLAYHHEIYSNSDYVRNPYKDFL